MKWKWQAYSTRHYFLVVSKRCLDCILAEPKEGCQKRNQRCCNDFVIKNTPKMFLFFVTIHHEVLTSS